MPIYEFRCESCDQVFELLALSDSERRQAECPQCGGRQLSRVLSTCAAVMGQGGQASQAPQVQNRSCAGSDSCSTITLPGHSK